MSFTRTLRAVPGAGEPDSAPSPAARVAIVGLVILIVAAVVASHQLAENTVLVFRGADDQKRTVLLVLGGVAASARSTRGQKEPGPPPLTLELSYIEGAAHPDIFKIGKGQS